MLKDKSTLLFMENYPIILFYVKFHHNPKKISIFQTLMLEEPNALNLDLPCFLPFSMLVMKLSVCKIFPSLLADSSFSDLLLSSD